MPPLLALYAKQFLEIQLFTFDYHENKSQRTIDYVLLDQRFIVRRSSPLNNYVLKIFCNTLKKYNYNILYLITTLSIVCYSKFLLKVP